jgi:hypothetical protein
MSIKMMRSKTGPEVLNDAVELASSSLTVDGIIVQVSKKTKSPLERDDDG